MGGAGWFSTARKGEMKGKGGGPYRKKADLQKG